MLMNLWWTSGISHLFLGFYGELVTKLGIPRQTEPVEDCFASPIGCVKNDVNNYYIICDKMHHVVRPFCIMLVLGYAND